MSAEQPEWRRRLAEQRPDLDTTYMAAPPPAEPEAPPSRWGRRARRRARGPQPAVVPAATLPRRFGPLSAELDDERDFAPAPPTTIPSAFALATLLLTAAVLAAVAVFELIWPDAPTLTIALTATFVAASIACAASLITGWLRHRPSALVLVVPAVLAVSVLAANVASSVATGPNRADAGSTQEFVLVTPDPSSRGGLELSGEIDRERHMLVVAGTEEVEVRVGPGPFSWHTDSGLGRLPRCTPVVFVIDATTLGGTTRTPGCP